MDLQNKQADQLNEIASIVTNTSQMMNSVRDPIQSMLDDNRKIMRRIRPRGMIDLFKESKKLMSEISKSSSSSSNNQTTIADSIDGNKEDFKGVTNTFNKFKETTDDYFDNLIDIRIGEDLPDMMNDFNSSHLERVNHLDSEYEKMFNREDDLHDFERDVENTFDDIEDTSQSFFSYFKEEMGDLGLSSGRIGNIDIGSQINQTANSMLDTRIKYRKATSSTAEQWDDFRERAYEDTRVLNDMYDNYEFSMDMRLNSINDLLDAGVKDSQKMIGLGRQVMKFDALAGSMDLGSSEFLQSFIMRSTSKEAEDMLGFVNDLTASMRGIEGVKIEDIVDEIDNYGTTIKSLTDTNREFEKHIENISDLEAALSKSGIDETSRGTIKDTLFDLAREGLNSDQLSSIVNVFSQSDVDMGINEMMEMIETGDYDKVGAAYTEAIRDVFGDMDATQRSVMAEAIGIDLNTVMGVLSGDEDILGSLEDVESEKGDYEKAAEEADKTPTEFFFSENMGQRMEDRIKGAISDSKAVEILTKIAEDMGVDMDSVTGGFKNVISGDNELINSLGSGIGAGGSYFGLKGLKNIFTKSPDTSITDPTSATDSTPTTDPTSTTSSGGLLTSMKTGLLANAGNISQLMSSIGPGLMYGVDEFLKNNPKLDEIIYGDYSYENIEENGLPDAKEELIDEGNIDSIIGDKYHPDTMESLDGSVNSLDETIKDSMEESKKEEKSWWSKFTDIFKDNEKSNTDSIVGSEIGSYNNQMEGLLDHDGLSELMNAVYKAEGGEDASVPYGLTGFRDQGNQFNSASRKEVFSNLLSSTGYEEGSEGYWAAAAASTLSRYVDYYISKNDLSAQDFASMSSGNKDKFIDWLGDNWAPEEGDISEKEKELNPYWKGNTKSYLEFSEGGLLPGYGGGDIVPAMLEPGELILSKEVVRDGFRTAEKVSRMSNRDMTDRNISVIVNNDDVVQAIRWATKKMEKVIKETNKDSGDKRREIRKNKNPLLDRQINLN